MIKNCVICGGAFKSSPSANKTTCGPACRSARAAKSATGEGKRQWSASAKKRLSKAGQTRNLKKGTLAAQKSPIAGMRKTHKNALVWTLQTPSGDVVKCQNLNYWLRQVFSDKKTRELARCGILQIRRSRLGKTKRRVTQWRGYRLIDVAEPQYIVVRLKYTNFYIKMKKRSPPLMPDSPTPKRRGRPPGATVRDCAPAPRKPMGGARPGSGRPHKWDPALGPLRHAALPDRLLRALDVRAFRDAVVSLLRVVDLNN